MIPDNFMIVVREFMNGTWAVGSLILILVLLHYLWKSAKESDWHTNVGMQFAAALTVLLSGHFIRSFVNWAEFSRVTFGLNAEHWAELSPITLIAATAVLLAGKGAVLYLFSPIKWRLPILFSAAVLTLGIPALVYFLW